MYKFVLSVSLNDSDDVLHEEESSIKLLMNEPAFTKCFDSWNEDVKSCLLEVLPSQKSKKEQSL